MDGVGSTAISCSFTKESAVRSGRPTASVVAVESWSPIGASITIGLPTDHIAIDALSADTSST